MVFIPTTCASPIPLVLEVAYSYDCDQSYLLIKEATFTSGSDFVNYFCTLDYADFNEASLKRM